MYHLDRRRSAAPRPPANAGPASCRPRTRSVYRKGGASTPDHQASLRSHRRRRTLGRGSRPTQDDRTPARPSRAAGRRRSGPPGPRLHKRRTSPSCQVRRPGQDAGPRLRVVAPRHDSLQPPRVAAARHFIFISAGLGALDDVGRVRSRRGVPRDEALQV